jgi:hypothetical protein
VKNTFKDLGIFPGKEKMPVEDKLFDKIVVEFNFDKKYAAKCIEDNRHNHITACYHLIDKRNRKLKDRQESYQQTKIDFKKKMRLGNEPPAPKAMTIEAANKTVAHGERISNNVSPAPHSIDQKQDLNMTAPIHSEQVKNRKIDFTGTGGSSNGAKARDASHDYQTI